ncbi:hypothetical protein [Arcticibacter sp. MXS-1]|uniref:hypothetical protein n=1 Tax=Arcticibacter sp. MXS-1 TaxID=3341726 RepID=UPI0035A92FA0
MKYITVMIFLTSLVSCQSRKAREFDAFLDSTERKVYRTLVGDSLEDIRLKALIEMKPNEALSVGKRQANELSNVIKEIENSDVSDIKEAKALKQAAINYYLGLLDLKKVDIQEAELMRAHQENARKAEQDSFNLPRKRLQIHRIISVREEAMHQARLRFEKANDIP